MSHTTHLAPAAQRDIADAYAYYAQFEKHVAFVAATDSTFAQISDRPMIYPVVYANVRRALLRRFPFSIFFLIETDNVVVLAVDHQRRQPPR